MVAGDCEVFIWAGLLTDCMCTAEHAYCACFESFNASMQCHNYLITIPPFTLTGVVRVFSGPLLSPRYSRIAKLFRKIQR